MRSMRGTRVPDSVAALARKRPRRRTGIRGALTSGRSFAPRRPGSTADMDDDDERRPDHAAEPRKQEVGRGGYPETNPAGAHDDDAEDGADRSGGDTGGGAPEPTTESETDREQSTGNPGAAG